MKLKTEFQDEDFRKGEVADVSIATIPDGRIIARAKAKSGGEHTFYYNCIETLCNDWSDYEEPKEHWCVTMYGGITRIKDDEEPIDDLIEIGNYFNSKEDAYDAVDKLKAWKRLKDEGFSFINLPYKKICKYDVITGVGNLEYQVKYYEELESDLDLLFGGEE